MKKLLVICGPTSSGKTSLAIRLSKKFKGELVSADSRQVYRGLDIGTGKDLPDNPTFELPIADLKEQGIGCYRIKQTRVWGYDLVDPKNRFSVSQYTRIIKRILSDIWERQTLPILVGGTGLYIKSVVDGIETADIPRNEELRRSLTGKNAKELYELLAVGDPIKAASMNLSDKNNPTRLIRAIEIAADRKELSLKSVSLKNNPEKYDVLFIGLVVQRQYLSEKIKERVDKRIDKGLLAEIKKLLGSGVSWDDQSMNTLGYKEWRDYFEAKADRNAVVKKWIQDELRYARRQMTWFKKDKRINWFDVLDSGWEQGVDNLVKKWQNKI